MRDPAGMMAALCLPLVLGLLPVRTDGVNISVYQGTAGPGWNQAGAAGGYVQFGSSGNSFFWSDGYYGDGYYAWNNFLYGFNPYYFVVYYPNPWALGPGSSLSSGDYRDTSPALLAYRTRGKLVAYPNGQTVILYQPELPYTGWAPFCIPPPAVTTPVPPKTGVTILPPLPNVWMRRDSPSARAGVLSSTAPQPLPARTYIVKGGPAVGLVRSSGAQPAVRTNAAPASLSRSFLIVRPTAAPTTSSEKQR
ncbi:MAG: hypothetical protein NTV49_14840 [Kiritimatiellaeota bacterium]|nr:hypothetical protein [Kiritimatiellota bacterium]